MLMIIDAHAHIGRLKDSRFEKMSFEQILKNLLKEMKEGGVDQALILTSWEDDDETSIPLGKALQITNGKEHIKIVGSIDLPNYKKKDLEKLEESLLKKKIIAVKLYLGYQHVYPYDKVCHPVYRLCQKYDVPVIFHTGDTLVYEGYAKVKYAHPLNIDEVAVDFPDLKIIIAHLGNPWMMDCAEVLYKNKNVYGDVSGLVVGDHLNTSYGLLMKKKIQELMLYSSPRKLLYGTDWPLSPMKSYIKFVKSLGISKQDLDYVFFKNAAELFKIKI